MVCADVSAGLLRALHDCGPDLPRREHPAPVLAAPRASAADHGNGGPGQTVQHIGESPAGRPTQDRRLARIGPEVTGSGYLSPDPTAAKLYHARRQRLGVTPTRRRAAEGLGYQACLSSSLKLRVVSRRRSYL